MRKKQKVFWKLFLSTLYLSAFTFGSLFSLLYSLVGSILSLMLMAVLKTMTNDRFSMLSVSTAGGIAHCMGQWLVASLVVGFDSLRWYAPILYFSGLISGFFIGFLAMQCTKRGAL